jgi:hypothetical protein
MQKGDFHMTKSVKTVKTKTTKTAKPKPSQTIITVEQARRAFDDFYKRTAASKSAKTYDLNHTKNVISDARYLGKNGPRLYDFKGVDTGAKTRAALSAAQLNALTAARKKLATKLKALRAQKAI